MKTQLITGLVLLSTVSGFASEEKRAWNRDNNPVKMGYDYITKKYSYKVKFDELPASGSLSVEPWSGDYWPTYKGGITYRWAQGGSDLSKYNYKMEKNVEGLSQEQIALLSPAEKYDLFVGRDDYPLTNFERQRTNIMKTVPSSPEYDASFTIPTWEGLCHSWAPATVLFENPRAVTVTSANGMEIPFGASDVKALLTFHLHYNNAQTQFLGGRCNVDLADLKRKMHKGEITKEEYERIAENGVCEDTNAGAFHIVLANQIALMDESFIADVTRDAEVWNQAVHSYDTRILNVSEGASEKAAKGTVKEITVETRFAYTVEIGHSWYETSNVNSTHVKVYRYTLELDKDGNIIGGEWLTDDRPDFLWKQGLPQWNGFFAPLKEIYEASINQ